MGVSHSIPSWIISLLLWVARIWALGAAYMLSLFFVEHMTWFRNPGHLPPAWVFIAQAFHLVLIIGLLIGWRWQMMGATLALIGAAGFFIMSGSNIRVAMVIGLAAAPAFLWLAHIWLSRLMLRAGHA